MRFKKNNDLDKLTDKEKDVAAWLAAGYSDKEVADKLFLSPSTVKKHRFNVLRKLGEGNFLKVGRLFFGR